MIPGAERAAKRILIGAAPSRERGGRGRVYVDWLDSHILDRCARQTKWMRNDVEQLESVKHRAVN